MCKNNISDWYGALWNEEDGKDKQFCKICYMKIIDFINQERIKSKWQR